MCVPFRDEMIVASLSRRLADDAALTFDDDFGLSVVRPVGLLGFVYTCLLAMLARLLCCAAGWGTLVSTVVYVSRIA